MFTDWIAVRLGSAALAGLPLLLLFMEPFTLSVGRGFLGTTVAFCHRRRRLSGPAQQRGQGPHQGVGSTRTRPPARRPRHPGARGGRAAGRVRLGGAGPVLPLVIPGLHVTRLFGGQPGSAAAGEPARGRRGGRRRFPRRRRSRAAHQELDGRPTDVLVFNTTQIVPGLSPDLRARPADRLRWRLSQPASTARVDPGDAAPPGLTNRSYADEVDRRSASPSAVGANVWAPWRCPPGGLGPGRGGPGGRPVDLHGLRPGTALAGLDDSVTSLSDSPPEQALNGAPPPPAAIEKNYAGVPRRLTRCARWPVRRRHAGRIPRSRRRSHCRLAR